MAKTKRNTVRTRARLEDLGYRVVRQVRLTGDSMDPTAEQMAEAKATDNFPAGDGMVYLCDRGIR